MNPSNPFGSPQGGAFQAPSNTMKTGLFQSFGQQGSSNQSQTGGFYQPSAFGQPSPHGNTIFGQTPAFGQSSTQPSSLPTASHAPAFGQPSLGMSSSGFNTTPAFGQTSGPNQSSLFGQTPAFGQPSAFGQASGFSQQPQGFGKQTSGFGQQPTGFGTSQMASGSTTSVGQPQPMGFGPSMFGQPSSTNVTTSVFGTGQNVTQSRGFRSSKFSFKPANEALFKPIFSASPEPANPQTTSMSSSPFGSSGSQTSISTMSSSITTTCFPPLTGAKSGQLDFSFSQPAAAPSISAQNNPLTTGNSSGPSNTLQFTFSQPAAPSSSSTQASTTQPTTPSSFSFSAQGPLPQTTPLFRGTCFGQPSAFGDIKAKAEIGTDEKGQNLESQGDTNVFARLSKGTKRKEDLALPSTGSEKPATEEDAPAEADSPRHPSKRPLVRTRGPPRGLFSKALSDLRRDGPNPVKREATKDTEQPASTWEQTEGEEVQSQSDSLPVNPPTAQALARDLPEKTEESGETTKSFTLYHMSCAPKCVNKKSRIYRAQLNANVQNKNHSVTALTRLEDL